MHGDRRIPKFDKTARTSMSGCDTAIRIAAASSTPGSAMIITFCFDFDSLLAWLFPIAFAEITRWKRNEAVTKSILDMYPDDFRICCCISYIRCNWIGEASQEEFVKIWWQVNNCGSDRSYRRFDMASFDTLQIYQRYWRAHFGATASCIALMELRSSSLCGVLKFFISSAGFMNVAWKSEHVFK